MTRRMFPNDPPSITFTKDFHQRVHGDLLPGRTVTINYDAERLPNERSEDVGREAWTIQAFYKFTEQGEVHVTGLGSETGKILRKASNEPGEGTMMDGRINVPVDADHLTIWFLNTGKSGAKYWDSNFGKNYVFRFVVQDLDIESVEVIPDEKNPLSWFRIEVNALPEVSDLAVMYRIMNDPTASRVDKRLALTPAPALDASRKRQWSGSAQVPQGAVVRLTFVYDAFGNPHKDTNSGNGYLTWAGAKRNSEAGVI